MTVHTRIVSRAVLLGCLALSGCALFRKGHPLHVRYFAPELSSDSAVVHGVAAGSPLRVRLGRVSSGPHLGQRITVRSSSVEVGYREDMRWTERPDAYLRRDLAQVLFEQRGLLNIVSGPGPTLEVELVAFEEVTGAQHQARFQAVMMVSTDRTQLVEQTITEEVEIKGIGPTAVISAMTIALGRGVSSIADATSAALAGQAALRDTVASPGAAVGPPAAAVGPTDAH